MYLPLDTLGDLISKETFEALLAEETEKTELSLPLKYEKMQSINLSGLEIPNGFNAGEYIYAVGQPLWKKIFYSILMEMQLSKFFPKGIDHITWDVKSLVRIQQVISQYQRKDEFLRVLKAELNTLATADSNELVNTHYSSRAMVPRINSDSTNFNIIYVKLNKRQFKYVMNDIDKGNNGILQFPMTATDVALRCKNHYKACHNNADPDKEYIDTIIKNKECHGIFAHDNSTKLFALDMSKRVLFVFAYIPASNMYYKQYCLTTSTYMGTSLIILQAVVYTTLMRMFLEYNTFSKDERFTNLTPEEADKKYGSAWEFFEQLSIVRDYRYTLAYAATTDLNSTSIFLQCVHEATGEVLHNLQMSSVDQYIQNTFSLYKSLKDDIKKFTAVWETKLVHAKQRIDELKKGLSTLHADMNTLMKSIEAKQLAIDTANAQLNSLIHFGDKAKENVKSIITFLENNKHITQTKYTNSSFAFELVQPMHFGNYDEFKKNWNKDKDSYQRLNEYQKKAIDAMMEFMQEKSRFAILGYACFKYTFSDTGATGNYTAYLPSTKQYLTSPEQRPAPGNPHFCYFTCYGDFKNLIIEAIKSNDFEMALNIMVEAAAGLNSFESCNVEYFMNNIVYQNTKMGELRNFILDRKTGEKITIDEAFKRLKEEQENTDEHST